MIQLQPFRQSTSFCGPASLKMVLEYYSVHKTEAELGELCHTTSEQGTYHQRMVEAVFRLGLEATQQEQASISELKKLVDQGIPVIVGWFSADEDHFSVVVEVTPEEITLMDPELDEGIRKMSCSDFASVWQDTDGPERKQVKHWMMWISSSRQ